MGQLTQAFKMKNEVHVKGEHVMSLISPALMWMIEIITSRHIIALGTVGTWESARCQTRQEMCRLIRQTGIQEQQHFLLNEMRGGNLKMPFNISSVANACQCFKMILLITWDYSLHVVMKGQKNVFLKEGKHCPTQFHCYQFR